MHDKKNNLIFPYIYFLDSLAKGTEENINSLVEYGILEILLEIVLNDNSLQLIEVCLGVIKTIFQFITNHQDVKVAQLIENPTLEMLHQNIHHLTRLIQLASPETSINFQAHVVGILLAICNSSNVM